MNYKPKITIVTITYNLVKNGRKDFIIQNIESVHRQNYKNIEHIIIDGASDDGTLELLKPYEEKGWIKIYSEPDNGIYDAMNKGLAKATGEYISYLNSDDFYHDKKGVGKVVEALSNNDVEFAYSSNFRIDEQGNPHCIQIPIPELFFVRMPFCHQTLFLKTTTMKELKGFDLSFKSAGDYDLIIRLYLNKALGIDYKYNFVSFREAGYSYVDREQSNNECILAFKKNFSKLIDREIDFKTMFFKLKVKKDLLKAIMGNVNKHFVSNLKILSEWYKEKDDEIIIKGFDWKYDYKNYLNIVKTMHGRRIDSIYLFGLELYSQKTMPGNKNKTKYIAKIPFIKSTKLNGWEITKGMSGLFKKKKSKMYSKYYFLGIQVWSKKKSKISISMKKGALLQNKAEKI